MLLGKNTCILVFYPVTLQMSAILKKTLTSIGQFSLCSCDNADPDCITDGWTGSGVNCDNADPDCITDGWTGSGVNCQCTFGTHQ